jgi:DNA-binding Xre family transcriptional regulator
MTITIRLKDFMDEAEITNAYGLVQAVKAVKGNVGEATVYRLVRRKGKFDSARADLLEALAKVFDCTIGELFDGRRQRR